MSSITEILQHRVVEKAIVDAGSQDDYRLSRWASLLDGEQTDNTLDSVALALGEAGYIGVLYVEQNDLGNGKQDIAAPRVNLEIRRGEPVDAKRARRMASSTIAILRRFPEDLR